MITHPRHKPPYWNASVLAARCRSVVVLLKVKHVTERLIFNTRALRKAGVIIDEIDQ